MDTLWHDVRYALRGMRAQPWFTALAVVTLALGIGAATTMYSVIHNVLFDPFPYNAERVVAPQIRNAANPNQQGGRSMFQTAEFLDLQEQSSVFEEVIAGGYEEILYTTREGTELFTGALVSGNLFQFLAVPAVAGRTLTPEDAKPNAPPVCVIAWKMWRRVFNEDPGVVGQTLVLNGVPTTVVGVMPKRFTKQNADIYKPVVLDRADPRAADRFYMFQARLKPGVTLEQAQADLAVIFERLRKVYPRIYPEKFNVGVVYWVDNIVLNFKRTLYTLGAAVGLLLLIACGNVANMLLARAASRQKEMAVRAALGAGRTRLIRQLLVESLLLALLGMALGCLFAHFGLKALVTMIPEGQIPREAEIRLNLPVLGFSLGAAAITALIFGLVPALQTARRDLVEPLKDTGKGAGAGFRGGRLRASLVVLEVAMSLVLLVGAGLMMRSFLKMQAVDLGFEPGRLMFARLPFPRGQYQTAEAKHQYFRALLPRIRSLPGVTAVTPVTSVPPFGGVGTDFDIPGLTHTERWNGLVDFCDENYLATFEARLLRGRFFTEQEVASVRPVAVVNQTFVKQFLKGEDPIGRQVLIQRLANTDGRTAAPAFEIVGVVSDVRNNGLDRATQPQVQVPYGVTGLYERGVIVRTAGDPAALVNPVRAAIWAQDANVAVTDANSLQNFLRLYPYAMPRFTLLVFAVFAGVGLVLITVGVYSVMAYAVARQTHEIGIRMALGASAGDVLRMILRTGMGLVLLGGLVGLAVSLMLGRFLASQLREVPPNDPLTLGTVLALMVVTGLAACLIPARRATRVDPMTALRQA
ncbi:MAG TPA: ABC transporter permease [Opitutaceae bacterium]|nr:ABC transporter permease [Opitutaceae bacterium]